ncbi:MAG: 5-oxoprolinase subunit PxpB [Lachnospiraceae bacterium]|nr:5-oxoprolinase subunit PxpB [Lachnospiraceae bacterium]
MVMKPVGDQAVLVEFGSRIEEETNRKVMAFAALLSAETVPGFRECVPAFASLLVCYDPLVTEYETMCGILEGLAAAHGSAAAGDAGGHLVEIPVCYGGSYGEDLGFVAEHAGLSTEEVIHIHSGRNYRIYMLGFLPGFPYLGGMDARIFTPRLSNPRTRIPAGSVGIGGEQTGIYPMDSPGGWQLIGRTPWKLFDPMAGGKTRYEAGDVIRFVPISEAQFREYEAAEGL